MARGALSAIHIRQLDGPCPRFGAALTASPPSIAPMPSSSLVRALALSCHPIPALAVTALSAGLAALAHLPVGRGLLLTATILTGQLSIGWGNDYLDAERDRAVAGASHHCHETWSPTTCAGC